MLFVTQFFRSCVEESALINHEFINVHIINLMILNEAITFVLTWLDCWVQDRLTGKFSAYYSNVQMDMSFVMMIWMSIYNFRLWESFVEIDSWPRTNGNTDCLLYHEAFQVHRVGGNRMDTYLPARVCHWTTARFSCRVSWFYVCYVVNAKTTWITINCSRWRIPVHKWSNYYDFQLWN